MKRRWKIVRPNSTVKYDYAFPDKGFPLSVMRFSSFVPINQHRHDFHELVLVTSGKARHDLGDFRYYLQTRDVFLIAPDQYHGYEECENFSYYNVLVDFRALGNSMFDLASSPGWQVLQASTRSSGGEKQCCRLSTSAYDRCCKCLEDILALQTLCPPGYHFSIFVGFLDFLKHLCDDVGRQNTQFQTCTGASCPQLSDFIRYYAGNPGRPWTIADLIRSSGQSRATVFREFKKHCGMSPAKFQMHCRLHNAAALLRHSSDSTEAISRQCGFSSAGHFATVFRKEFGMSPTQYRAHK